MEFEYFFDGLHLRRIQYDGGRFPGRIIYKRRRPERLIPDTESKKLKHYLMDMMLQQLRPLEKYVEVGFRKGKRMGFLAALCRMKEDALICDGFQNSFVLPDAVTVSEGNLAMEDSFEAYFDQATSEICVTWDTTLPITEEGQTPARDDDRLLIVAQDVWGSYEVYGKIDGAPRSAGTERILVEPLDDRAYFVYVAFISADGNSQSHSICLQDGVYT